MNEAYEMHACRGSASSSPSTAGHNSEYPYEPYVSRRVRRATAIRPVHPCAQTGGIPSHASTVAHRATYPTPALIGSPTPHTGVDTDRPTEVNAGSVYQDVKKNVVHFLRRSMSKTIESGPISTHPSLVGLKPFPYSRTRRSGTFHVEGAVDLRRLVKDVRGLILDHYKQQPRTDDRFVDPKHLGNLSKGKNKEVAEGYGSEWALIDESWTCTIAPKKPIKPLNFDPPKGYQVTVEYWAAAVLSMTKDPDVPIAENVAISNSIVAPSSIKSEQHGW